MAATDTPPDDTTSQPQADPNAVLNAAMQYLMGQRQQATPAPAPVNRSIVSLLGEAVGGGTTGMSPAEQEAAGRRALLNFGANLSAASDYSTMPHTFGSLFAQGVGGAQQSLAGSEAVSAARLGAQQAYEEKQQELQLARIKELIPLLTLQQEIAGAAGARKLLGGGGGGAAAPGTSISDVGAPVILRDPKAGTAGQQANNPGNIMMAPGANIAGASGAIPLPGGRYVAAFPDVPTGVAAHSDLLTKYAQSGVGTIRDAVTRWVGDPKADLTSYIADVAKAAGVGPDDKVDLSNPKIQRAILLAQQPHESGKPWLSADDVDKGLSLAAARRAGAAKAPGAPPAASAPPGAPAPAPTATAPPAASGTPSADTSFGTPYQVASAGPNIPPPPTAPTAAAPAEALPLPDAMAKAKATGQPVPFQGGNGAVITPRGTVIMPSDAVAQTPPPPTGIVPAAATAPPDTATTPTGPPQYPDIKSGDVTISHPGNFADYFARERAPPPTTEDFNPNLSTAQQAVFAAKAKAISAKATALEQEAKGIGNLDPKKQPEAVASILERRGALAAERASLDAEQATAAQTKTQAAAAAQTKFDTEQRDAVQKRYDAALAHYREVAKGQITFNQDIIKSQATKRDEANQKLLEPYQNGATQAQSIRPSIDLARQIEQSLPEGASPWLNKPENREKLARYEQFLPKNWSEALQGADLFSQIMGNMVTQMGANLVSGQPGGREAAYQQFRTMLPSLAQSKTGRELALTFIDELGQRRVAENEFMQNYSWDPKNRDPELHVPNMSGATTAMNKPGALPPMLKLPPLSYDPNLPATDQRAFDNRKRYNDYYRSIQPGGRYITYTVDEQGKAHPVAKTKRPPVPDPTDPNGKRLIDQPPEGGED